MPGYIEAVVVVVDGVLVVVELCANAIGSRLRRRTRVAVRENRVAGSDRDILVYVLVYRLCSLIPCSFVLVMMCRKKRLNSTTRPNEGGG